MKRILLRLLWFRIGNKHFNAGLAIALLCAQSGFATTLVVLVSGNAIVFGADGKSVDTWVKDTTVTPVATGVFEKLTILQNQILISTTGIARIAGKYDFNSFVKALPVPKNASVEDVASIISKRSEPIFQRALAHLWTNENAPVMNLSGNKSLPIVTYFVGGVEFTGPKVYRVAIYVDSAKKQLKHPTVGLIYPPSKTVTKYKNIFIEVTGKTGGGIDKLYEPNSATQKKYLKLYNREVGAMVYDEPLDVDGLIALARILLTVGIETSPERYSFPISVCSSTADHQPTCKTYDH